MTAHVLADIAEMQRGISHDVSNLLHEQYCCCEHSPSRHTLPAHVHNLLKLQGQSLLQSLTTYNKITHCVLETFLNCVTPLSALSGGLPS